MRKIQRQTKSTMLAPVSAAFLNGFLTAFLAAWVVAAATAEASPQPGEPRTLIEKIGHERLSVGHGSMNGVASEFLNLAMAPTDTFESLHAAILRAAAGRLTITVESTDLSRVILIAAIHSQQCPTCPTAAQNPHVLDHTWVLTWAETGGMPLVLASPAGPMMRSLAATPRYSGTALKSALHHATVERQFDLTFASTRSQTTNLILNRTPHGARTLIQSDLRSAGFIPFAPDDAQLERDLAQRPESQGAEEVWTRGNKTVHVDLVAIGPEQTRINIRELTTDLKGE